jgi:hypothetical protein
MGRGADEEQNGGNASAYFAMLYLVVTPLSPERRRQISIARRRTLASERREGRPR